MNKDDEAHPPVPSEWRGVDGDDRATATSSRWFTESKKSMEKKGGGAEGG